jgi:macrolide transport system ATP-binding/permease protein
VNRLRRRPGHTAPRHLAPPTPRWPRAKADVAAPAPAPTPSPSPAPTGDASPDRGMKVGLERPRLAVRDLIDECISSLAARPGRTALTVLGTVIGIGALVATIGLSQTAGNQIVGRFDALAATDILVTPKTGGSGRLVTSLPWDAEQRIARLNGVSAVGTLSDVDLKGQLIAGAPVKDPRGQSQLRLPVKAASPGLYAAVRATLATGRLPDAGHSARSDRVAVLGPSAAERLHVTRVDNQSAIYLGDRLYVVIGILADVQRQPSLLESVIIPEGTAYRDHGLQAPRAVQIETRIGAVRLIAEQAPIALSPADPSLLKVQSPPEPRRAKQGVQSDLDALFLFLGGLALLVGAIGIANVTLVSVLERVGEIGLRRALGASQRHVAIQFLAESTVLGFAGGIIGASLGTLVIVTVASLRSWTPVVEGWVPLAAPAISSVIGLGAGLYPSLRAARMEPVEALRATA